MAQSTRTGRCAGWLWAGLGLMMPWLAACQSIEIPEIDSFTPPSRALDTPAADSPQAALGEVVIAVPATVPLGAYDTAIYCSSPYNQLYRTDLERSGINARWGGGAPGILQEAGFAPLMAGKTNVGDKITIHARITDLRLQLCREANILTGKQAGETGESYIKVQWQAVNAAKQVIERGETEGRATLEQPSRYGRIALAIAAFDDALARFAHPLNRDNREPVPAQAAPSVMDEAPDQTSPFQPVTPVTTAALTPVHTSGTAEHHQTHRLLNPALPTLNGPIERHAARLLAAMVRVDTDQGSQLGVLIDTSDQGGLAMVPRHPGFDPAASTVTAIRDTAGQSHHGVWITSEDAPYHYLRLTGSESRVKALPMARNPVRVGDPIYAITLPIREPASVEPAISRGVVSDRCKPTDPEARTGISFQADLPISRHIMLNNSTDQAGGVILDASGNLLGLAVPDHSGDHSPLMTGLGMMDGFVCFQTLNTDPDLAKR